MKLQIQNTWIDLRAGVRLFVGDGMLVIDDHGADADLAPIVAKTTKPAKKAKPAADKPTADKPKRRRAPRSFDGTTENDVLVKLSQMKPADKFHRLNQVYAMVRPHAPARDNGKPSRDYNHVRETLRRLAKEGLVETQRVSPKRVAFRLSPTLHDVAAEPAGQAD